MILFRAVLLVVAIPHICNCLDMTLSNFISERLYFYHYSGRGAFETMGAGVDMSFDDIAFKCNFAYINDETGIVERRRVDREFHWGVSLCDDLNDLKIPGFEEYIVKCEYATEHRCGLKVTGKNLSS